MDDAIDFCIYFRLFCNGTAQLVKVWHHIIYDKSGFKVALGARDRNCFWLFERADLMAFLDEEGEPSKWHDRVGCSQFPRFQFNTKGPAVIKKNISAIRQSIKRVVIFLATNPTLSNKNLHIMFVDEMSKYKAIGPICLNQLFHCLCLTGLLPL